MFKYAKNLNLYKIVKKNFKLLGSEEYLLNMKESLKKISIDSAKLAPFPEASNYI
jgi:hypothetical protein